MAILIASVKNALSKKAKAEPKHFIFTNRRLEEINKKPKKKEDGMIQIGSYMPIKEADLQKYIRNPKHHPK